MKVLSKGAWRHQYVCEECMAVLLTGEEDFRSRHVDQGGGGIEIYCECCECGTDYVPDTKNIPKDVWDRIVNRKTPRPDPFPTSFIHPDTRFKSDRSKDL